METVEKKRVLTFAFLDSQGISTREPNEGTGVLSINGEGFDLSDLPEAIQSSLAWHGLKQKLSDYVADSKGKTAAERLAGIRACYEMLKAGDWSRAGERGVAKPATAEEIAEAIIRVARVRKVKVNAEQAEAKAKKLVGTDLPEALKAMVVAIRTEARAEAKAGAPVGGEDLAGIFE